MNNETKSLPQPTQQANPAVAVPKSAPARVREMSLAKAKKLIRKTSAMHDGLFRRLSK